MATNIALQSGVISVTEGSGEPKYYFGAVGKYGFSTDQSKVRVQIFYSPGVDEYNIPFSDLMVGGQTPSSVAEAKVLLNAVFLNANSSSGGSGSSYLVASVTLTDAQIKALPTTAVTLISAPGANKIIAPIYVMFVLNNWVANYTNIHGSSLIGIKQDGNNAGVSLLNNASGGVIDSLLAGGAEYYCFVSPNASVANSVTYAAQSYPLTEAANLPLTLDMTNLSGNLTGGNAANTLKVTVYYVVVDL